MSFLGIKKHQLISNVNPYELSGLYIYPCLDVKAMNSLIHQLCFYNHACIFLAVKPAVIVVG